MKQNQIIEAVIQGFQPNELIFASRLFNDKLEGKVSEATYYKTLERMCKSGKLAKVAKGTYYLPKKSVFGDVPISEREIITAFTKEGTGTVIGYSLYNHLGLTTQIPKTTEILSSSLDSQMKTIRNVKVHYSSLEFSKAVEQMIQALDVLQNYEKIQDINYPELVSYSRKIAEDFEQLVFDQVIDKQKYAKSTIAFLQSILNYYGKENRLNKYLSSLSKYKYPRMEELYAAAQLPQLFQGSNFNRC